MSEAIDYLQPAICSGYGFDGDTSSPFWQGYTFPLLDVEHPLKGLLRDKGCASTIEQLEQQLDHYLRAARRLSKMVADHNANHPAPLMSLGLHKKTTFAWRSYTLLDTLTGFTNKTDRFYFFRKTYPHYRELKEFFKGHDQDLYAFYRAVDAVRSDVEIRLRITSRLITEHAKAHDIMMNDEDTLRITEKRHLVPILQELNKSLLRNHQSAEGPW